MGTSNSGFSDAGLRRLREVLAQHVASKRIPGLVALVSRGGRTHVEAIGTMRHDGGAPMRRDTIFRMASTSKPVTMAAAMILLDECRLRLDDPVDQWLPELADRQVLKRPDGPLDDTVLAHRPITVRDLLTSTFGLGVDFESMASPIRAATFERLDYSVASGPPRSRTSGCAASANCRCSTSPECGGSTTSATRWSVCSSPGSRDSRWRRSCGHASSIRWG